MAEHPIVEKTRGKKIGDKIVEDFAKWAAASSARQGCSLRGKKWYRHIERLNFDLIMDRNRGPITSSEFDELHKSTVEKLAKEAQVEIGWAAKIVNMLLKVKVYIHDEGRDGLKECIHPVMDNILIDKLKSEYSSRRDNQAREIFARIKLGKPINGIKSYAQYKNVVDGCRLVARDKKMYLFQVEKFWRVEK